MSLVLARREDNQTAAESLGSLWLTESLNWICVALAVVVVICDKRRAGRRATERTREQNETPPASQIELVGAKSCFSRATCMSEGGRGELSRVELASFLQFAPSHWRVRENLR